MRNKSWNQYKIKYVKRNYEDLEALTTTLEYRARGRQFQTLVSGG